MDPFVFETKILKWNVIFIDPCIVDDSVEITNKMQPCNSICFSKVYWRLNMFRAAHRSPSGALNCICSLWVGNGSMDPFPTQPWQRPVTSWVYTPEAANTVYSSWWWAVCRSKHVEPSINFGIINSITKLHLVGIATESLKWKFGLLLHTITL